MRYFVAIADELSISRAASKLFVSQPSMSNFLLKLESRLGVKLCVRRPNNALVLTEAGEVYLDGARKILKINEQMMRNINAMKLINEENFIIGLAGVKNSLILPNLIPRMCKQHPDLNIDIMERGTYELMKMVIDGNVDMAFAAYDPQDLNPQLSYISLAFIPLDVIVPMEHRLAKRDGEDAVIDITELKDEPLILLKADTVQRCVLERYFEQVGFKPMLQMEGHTTHSTISFVESGAAVGFCPRDRKCENVVKLRLSDNVGYQMGIYYSKSRNLTHVMKNCIKIMKENS